MERLFDNGLIQFVEEIVRAHTGTSLTDIQTTILKESLNHKRYSEMVGYDPQYLKNEGAKLWKLLSDALNETLNKRNFHAILTRHWQSHLTRHQDWGEAPGVPAFIGRTKELETLEQWIIQDRCQLVAILGMKGIGKTQLSMKLGKGDRPLPKTQAPIKLGKGGIGKTDLSLKLIHGIQEQFDYVIWRRLLNSPPLQSILTDCILFFSSHQDINIPATETAQIAQVLHYFQRHRCLLILDNLETIFKSGNDVGHYRASYEGYGSFLQKVGEVSHQSCLLLTSRETPKHLEPIEGLHKPVRFYRLNGLNFSEGKALFDQIDDFQGSPKNWEELIDYYNGNPLALELAAQHIRTVFNGDISKFWNDQKPLFRKIKELLSWHFQRLSDRETEVVYFLAINREPLTLDDLRKDLVSTTSKTSIQETLNSLQQKLPLEYKEDKYNMTLHPVLTEYSTDCVIQQIHHEICSGEIDALNRYYILKVQAPDYVIDSQIGLLLTPIIERLKDQFHSPQQVEQQFKQILTDWQQKFPHRSGYLAGNILNFLSEMKIDLSDYDFSEMAVWQANLQGQLLHRINFAHSDLSNSIFTKAFGGIHAVAFSRDNNILAVGDSHGQLRLLRMADTQTIAISDQSHEWFVTSLSFNLDNTRLVSSAMDANVHLWDISESKLIHLNTLSGHTDWVWQVVFSPDDCLIATGSDDCTIRLWDADTGLCQKILTGHQGWVVSVAFHPHRSHLASGSTDGTVRFWDLESGECITSLDAHETGVWPVVYSPDGKIIVTGGWDAIIKIWDAETKNCLNILKGHQNPLKTLVFSEDGKLLVSGAGITQAHCKPTIKIWNVATGTCIQTYHGHQTGIRSLTLSPDQKTIASGDIEQVVKFWDVKTGQSLKTLSGHTAWIWSLDFSPDGQRLASGGLDHQVRLWDIQTQTCIQELSGHSAWVWNVSFCQSGKYLATSGDDQTIRIWNDRTGESSTCQKILNEFGTLVGGMWAMACHPDGHLIATAGQCSTVRVWDTNSGHFLREIGDHTPYWIWSLDFSPDGHLLASGSDDRTIKIWDMKTGELHQTLIGHTRKIRVIKFSPDGQYLVSGGEDTIVRVWDVHTGHCLTQLVGHHGWIWDVVVSTDSQRIASGGSDGSIRIWQREQETCIQILKKQNDYVTALAFHPDHDILASGNMNGSIQLWNTNTGKMLSPLQSPRPYEGMNIKGVQGLTDSQRSTLITLGAVSHEC